MPTRKNNTLEDLFSETLKDIYFAEKQILRALPKMAKEASSPELKQAFETHRDQTEGHVERLNEVFELLGKPARGKTCEAILGIIEEAKEIMEISRARRRSTPALSRQPRPSNIMKCPLRHAEGLGEGTGQQRRGEAPRPGPQEEIKTDQLLSKMATSTVNMKAA